MHWINEKSAGAKENIRSFFSASLLYFVCVCVVELKMEKSVYVTISYFIHSGQSIRMFTGGKAIKNIRRNSNSSSSSEYVEFHCICTMMICLVTLKCLLILKWIGHWTKNKVTHTRAIWKWDSTTKSVLIIFRANKNA